MVRQYSFVSWGAALIACILSLVCFDLRGAAQTPASDDISYATTQPAVGTKSLFLSSSYPTIRIWRFHNDGDLAAYTTTQSVGGPESAVILHLPAGGKPGELLIYDVAAQGEDVTHYKGVSFWMKGDGGDGTLSIGTNWNQQNEANARVGEFSLKEDQWHKYVVPFEKFSPSVANKGFYFINFNLKPATPRETRAVISRLVLYTDDAVEPIAPVTGNDPPGMFAASNFVTVPPGADSLSKVIGKLKAHQPVTIVAAGDSITAGNQLWYRAPEGQPQAAVDSIYTTVLAGKLAKQYGYTASRGQTYVWKEVDATSGKTEGGNTQSDFEQFSDTHTPLPGELPFEGLQVIGVASPGKGSTFGLDHLDRVMALKPDLIIWAYGANDAMGVTPDAYAETLHNMIQKVQDVGVDLILDTTSPWTGGEMGQPECYLTRTRDFREIARKVAVEKSIVLVDQYGAFTARGNRYLGDLLSDAVHPNEFGHRMLASTLAAALGVSDQYVWDQPIFRPATADH